MKLFQVQWRYAGEKLEPPGDWKTTGRFATKAEADNDILVNRKDWSHPRVYVCPTELDEWMRAERR